MINAKPLEWCGSLLAITTLLFGAHSVHAADAFRPTFPSEVAAPEEQMILPLLKAACGEGVRTVTAKGENAFGCGDSMGEILASRGSPRKYPWMPYVLWEADGVLFGHFLSPASEDVAINCFGCEGHPNLFGGTLLLTRNAGEWQPVWYKPGIITRHCRRVSLQTGRQILFCEETDGGMGHQIHGLYTIDFTAPKFAWRSVVLMADTYGALLGAVQNQSIERVSFEDQATGGPLVRVYARHGRVGVRPNDDDKPLPVPRTRNYEIDFQLQGETFVATPQTAVAARLFGVERQ